MEWNTFEMPASSASLRALYEVQFFIKSKLYWQEATANHIIL